MPFSADFNGSQVVPYAWISKSFTNPSIFSGVKICHESRNVRRPLLQRRDSQRSSIDDDEASDRKSKGNSHSRNYCCQKGNSVFNPLDQKLFGMKICHEFRNLRCPLLQLSDSKGRPSVMMRRGIGKVRGITIPITVTSKAILFAILFDQKSIQQLESKFGEHLHSVI